MILWDKQSTSFVLNINGKKISNPREIELKIKKHTENPCKKVSFKHLNFIRYLEYGKY